MSTERPPLQDFPPSALPSSRIIGGELLAFAASSVLYPFGIGRKSARTARQKEQRTVVLVHGYLGNRSSFFPLSLYLKARGVGPLMSYGSIRPTRPSLRTVSRPAAISRAWPTRTPRAP